MKIQLEKTLAQVSEISGWVNIALVREKALQSAKKKHTLQYTSHVKALFPPLQQQALGSGLLQQGPN